MEENSIVEATLGSQHVLKSMLSGRPAQAEIPVDAINPRCFKIRAAESSRERRSASSLVESMYASRGYQGASIPDDGSPHRRTFLASDHNSAIGTLTIGTDSVDGLMVDHLFASEVARFRAAGLRVCEFTKLAMDRRARSPRLLAALFHVAYIYAHRIHGQHVLLIEVNPRHVRYYQAMLGFDVIGAMRHNTRVNAPAVLLSLDLCHAEQQIRIFGGRPELALTERSAYPYFFSAKDEAGIADRLRRAGEDIAQVLDSGLSQAAMSRAETSLH